MTESYYPEVSRSLSLPAFIERIEGSGVIAKLRASRYVADDMEQVAGWMASLARDPGALARMIVDGLRDLRRFQADNDFKPSTLMLHRGEGYSIRAVLWRPPDDLHPPDIFSYYETHDHNFDFFTVGAFGPGYRTHLYEYDYDSVQGVPGEKIRLRDAGETGLPPGKVMYYYGSRDIHTQLPAPSISASINLLLPKTDPAHRRQYEMTLEETPEGIHGRLIAGRVDRLAQERILFQSAAALGNVKTHILLREIARDHEAAETRALAWQALLTCSKDRDADLCSALRDRDPHVRAVLAALGRNAGRADEPQ